MDMNLIEEINKSLQEAEREAHSTYEKLCLDEKFNNWFKDLNKDTKIEIYEMYQLNQLSLDD